FANCGHCVASAVVSLAARPARGVSSPRASDRREILSEHAQTPRGSIGTWTGLPIRGRNEPEMVPPGHTDYANRSEPNRPYLKGLPGDSESSIEWPASCQGARRGLPATRPIG